MRDQKADPNRRADPSGAAAPLLLHRFTVVPVRKELKSPAFSARCRHHAGGDHALRKAQTFVTAEVKNLIFEDRTTEVAAELMPRKIRPAQCKIAARIKELLRAYSHAAPWMRSVPELVMRFITDPDARPKEAS